MEVIGFMANGLIHIIIDGVDLFVPDEPGNRHRDLIAEWEAQGNVIPPYEEPEE